MRGFDQPAAVNQRSEVVPQFALGRSHDLDRSELVDERLEGRAVGPLCDNTSHRDSAPRLLEGEVTPIRQDQRQLLTVIGAATGFPRVFHQDNPEIGWVLARQPTEFVRQLIVRNEEPPAVGRLLMVLLDQTAEDAHGLIEHDWPWNSTASTGPFTVWNETTKLRNPWSINRKST